jgi:hypothetical protein
MYLLNLNQLVEVEGDEGNVSTLLRTVKNDVDVEFTSTQIVKVPMNQEVSLSLPGILGLVFVSFDSDKPIDISLFKVPVGLPDEGQPIYSGFFSHFFARSFDGSSYFDHLKLKGNLAMGDSIVKIVYAGNSSVPPSGYNLP